MFDYSVYGRKELERQYDIEATVADAGAILEIHAAASAPILTRSDARLDLCYGEHPLHRLDVFPAGEGPAPAMIYFHGGYWKAGDKADRAFPAPVFNARGIAWVSANYRLAPAATMDEIVADARAAVAWLHRHAGEFGIDAERIFLAGGSAGGHLAGMILAPGWHAEFAVPADVIKGACATSGLYDLGPFLLTGQNKFLRLDADSVLRNSPIAHLPDAGCPLAIAWGENETGEFKGQSMRYAEAYAARGGRVESQCLEGENHFSLLGQMGQGDSPLTGAMLGLMGLA